MISFPTDQTRLLATSLIVCSILSAEDAPLVLNVRTRVQAADGSREYHAILKKQNLNSATTAVVVCDMWDAHWCKGATRRVAEMAPRVNQVLHEARKRGMLIIHAPSNTLGYYKDTPQRKLAQAAPKVQAKVPLKNWCHLDKGRESSLPIDDRDGGCDCDPKCRSRRAWTKQIESIDIKAGDAITDNAEAYYLMKQRGIENVIVLGVHTNMCVLGRPFSVRQMAYQGMNVLLMRDLTDTMYNSRRSPFVSHFTGTDLVVEHIEKFWCPTITSADLLGGESFRFKNDKRKHIVFVIAEMEYKTKDTLPPFATKHLGRDFRVSFTPARRIETICRVSKFLTRPTSPSSAYAAVRHRKNRWLPSGVSWKAASHWSPSEPRATHLLCEAANPGRATPTGPNSMPRFWEATTPGITETRAVTARRPLSGPPMPQRSIPS